MMNFCKSAGIAALTILLITGTAETAEFKLPQVGESSTYKCTGPWGMNASYTITEMKGDVAHIEIDRDGKVEWIEKPYTALGLTLFSERQRNDGKGVRKQKLDGDVLAEYAQLVPGTKLKFNVREKHNEAQWEWGYEIEVGSPQTISHPILGEVEVVPVTEKRKVWKGSYSSEMETLVAAKEGHSVSWTYRDREGVQTCELVGVK